MRRRYVHFDWNQHECLRLQEGKVQGSPTAGGVHQRLSSEAHRRKRP